MAELSALIKGYREFYKKYFASGSTLYEELKKTGQSPKTLIIACSDSRVDPSIITSADPGDIFVIRNVANIVPPCEKSDSGLHGVSAALEFGVCVLGVRHIVVLGHSNCAGIHSLLNSDNVDGTDFIAKWVNVASAAKEKTIRENPQAKESVLQHSCEKESILLSLNNLLTFPWIKSRIEEKKLKLHGWYFAIADGSLHEYNPKKELFDKIPVE
ncbi:MAG: carbonic anhydrase [Alphaproteobacteria bacterium CG11_big_fil_rev_8_21_14_0_20_44_7]|nr:MAG: carbonic anhydrase [Alphaproteobacteria bacterium CG11_big_fil_rev_8_21_14_0_20_44_7]